MTTQESNAQESRAAPEIGFDDFLKVDIRAGTVLSAALNETARKPAFVLEVDFGPELGVKKTSAQLTDRYQADELIGRQVAAVVNFPPKQIAKMISEVLVLGFPDQDGAVILLAIDSPVPNGARLF